MIVVIVLKDNCFPKPSWFHCGKLHEWSDIDSFSKVISKTSSGIVLMNCHPNYENFPQNKNLLHAFKRVPNLKLSCHSSKVFIGFTNSSRFCSFSGLTWLCVTCLRKKGNKQEYPPYKKNFLVIPFTLFSQRVISITSTPHFSNFLFVAFTLAFVASPCLLLPVFLDWAEKVYMNSDFGIKKAENNNWEITESMQLGSVKDSKKGEIS